MEDFASSSTALIADVDCTADGQSLCEKMGVKGYPSIKWGDAADLKDYSGGRSYEAFKKHADENLGPQCGPGENIGLCDAATKAKIEKYIAMGLEKLEAKVKKVEGDVEVETPLMKKAMGYVKAQAAKKEL